ncbi:MAG TPA: ubiquitin-like small modifier protein 1 [Pyrinomonadaceae bacterium]|jgi:adenylyltransferase/sulfurtransferase
MPVTIAIPGALRGFADDQTEVEVEAATVGSALNLLTDTYPELRHHLYLDANTLRNFINVYLNEENIRHLQGFDTVAKAGDLVTIVPSIAGGA